MSFISLIWSLYDARRHDRLADPVDAPHASLEHERDGVLHALAVLLLPAVAAELVDVARGGLDGLVVVGAEHHGHGARVERLDLRLELGRPVEEVRSHQARRDAVVQHGLDELRLVGEIDERHPRQAHHGVAGDVQVHRVTLERLGQRPVLGRLPRLAVLARLAALARLRRRGDDHDRRGRGRAGIGLAEGDRGELGRPVEEQPVAHAGERLDQGETEAALGAERLLERGLLHRRRVEQRAEDERDQHRDQRAGGGTAPAAEGQPGAAAPVRRRLLVAGRRRAEVAWCPLVRHQNLK